MSETTVRANSTTDQDIERRIRNFLQSRNYPALRALEISVESGRAIVTGSVGTFHEKQMATSCCQRVAGVLDVINQIEVIRRDEVGIAPRLRLRK